ncbi:MAG: hypothetical protein KatS3mg118_3395 [Paracoccaceae bacterium]|nr:MAG: hypothetical protein D6686_14025 [Alphaproteobacteria bacterium]GIX15436.1 MAG: hypothetical protein KatS3mg118_3395 [Paracoccaceae bacterium]
MMRALLRLIVAGLLMAGAVAVGAGGFLAVFILLLRMDLVDRPLPLPWLGAAAAVALLAGLGLAVLVDRRAFRRGGA